MEIAIIGLGKMGADMARRLMRNGHKVVAFDVNPAAVNELAEEGATASSSLGDAASKLTPPRVLWSMVPAGAPTDGVIAAALKALEPGDVLVDGGNSNWRATLARAESAREAGIQWLDAGVSGGVWGFEDGYNLMVGGTEEAYRLVKPLLESLAPPGGELRVGPAGSGHFVKMIHNGIEYGLLQAYAEGFEALSAYPHAELDLAAIADLWNRGAVVRSWLLTLLAGALTDSPRLEGIAGYVDDSGTGRWTVEFGLTNAVPLPVITAALYARFYSRQGDSFAAKAIAALRRSFGGHPLREEPTAPEGSR